MSVRVMSAVWELDLPQNEKLVLLALADHSDDRGSCYPSVARLAWKSGYSVRQMQAIMKNLRDGGILEVIGSSAGGRGNVTQYQIHSEKGAKLAPFKAERVRPAAHKGCGGPRKRVRSSVVKGAVGRANPQSILIESSEPSVTVIEPSGAPAQKQPSHLAFAGLHLFVTERQDRALAAAFPWVDRGQQFRIADSWLEANPDRRPKKFARFLHNWFAKERTPLQKGGPSRAQQRHHENCKVAGFAN
jgi:Helix-turn-helix domain